MFQTGRDCAVCQPLLFSTAEIRHRAVSNLQCGWSCRANFDISAIILNPSVRTNSLCAKATVVLFLALRDLRACEARALCARVSRLPMLSAVRTFASEPAKKQRLFNSRCDQWGNRIFQPLVLFTLCCRVSPWRPRGK